MPASLKKTVRKEGKSRLPVAIGTFALSITALLCVLSFLIGRWRTETVLAREDPSAQANAADEAKPEPQLVKQEPPPESDKEVSRLIQLLQSKDVETCLTAVESLGKLGPRAKDAAPALIWFLRRYFEENQGDIQINSPEFALEIKVPLKVFAAIKEIGSDGAPSLAAIAINGANEMDRKHSIVALGFMGPRARSAIPVLVKLANGANNTELREEEIQALEKVDPQALKALKKLDVQGKATGEKKKEEWIDAKQGIQQGYVHVSVPSKSQVNSIVTIDSRGVQRGYYKEKVLIILVCIDNLSKTKKVEYGGWTKDTGTSLEDNFGNHYHRISLQERLVDQITDVTSIHPGAVLVDTLIFERPIDGIEFLRLELPASNFGGTGTLRLKIPANRIDRNAWPPIGAHVE